jgi:hypothetical protein
MPHPELIGMRLSICNEAIAGDVRFHSSHSRATSEDLKHST